jgi:hypothetical protein
MPNNVRQNYKRELERAEGNMDRALTKILAMATDYRELHPEISEALDVAIMGQLQVKEIVQKVRESI